MTQKLPRLYKVESYAFDFVIAENAEEAERANLDLQYEATVTEITEMAPIEDGYNWNPLDAKSGVWQELTCGEWLEQTAEVRRLEEEKTLLRDAAMAKLTQVELAAILDWAVGFK
jgi:hypothetical protein